MKLPVIPLRDLIVFPYTVTHFDAGRPKSVAAIESAEMNESLIFLVAQKDMDIIEPGVEDLYEYGTIAVIKQILKLPGGIVRVLVEGERRGKILSITTTGNFYTAEVEAFEEGEVSPSREIEAITRLIEEDLEEYSELDQRLLPGLLQTVVDTTTPGSMVDSAASYVNLKLEDNQALIEKVDVFERMVLFHELMKKEIELLSIEKNIDQQVTSSMNKIQREYYLKERLRIIHKELGDDEEEEASLNYSEKITKANLPPEVEERALKEAGKLAKVNSQSPEYTVIINYLDWILDLPWNSSSSEDIEISRARDILNKEHYGLKKVKERILEFLAVRKLSDSTKGPILCLVGPPGVGKTSIASSIAHALNKEFVRMSLGGVTDEAEIRGHRRTYVGALPGRVLTLLRKAGENNPVFLLDEIDKVGNNYRGDPASGLLEVLDPEQNNTFTDHYLELPFDLSKVFFITTANTTNTIPRPLLDRMEVISIGGYTPEEKFNIAKKYLIPKLIKENGMTKSQVSISDGAIREIINYYTREAGVRGLEKRISKIIRKAALKIVEENLEKVSATVNNIEEYLGERIFLYDLVDAVDQVGVVNGLAWTEVGGETLQIEVNVVPGSGKIQLTGSLGNVMKESAMAAISYILSNSEALGIDPSFGKDRDIHVHVPEGAVPKDGPSAGISICTAVISALSNRPVRRDVAMTGEITLRGRVLPIGGLKEKLLAAERMGIKKVLIPEDNKRDLREIEENVVENLQIVPVKNMKEVVEEALLDVIN